MSIPGDRQTQTISSQSLIVASGQTESNAVNFFGVRPVALSVPALVGVAAITFKVSLNDGVTYKELRDPDSNAPVSVVVDGSAQNYWLHAKHFAGIRFLKVVIDAVQAGDVEFLIAPLELY